jgi:hypothetical protein
MQHSVEELIKKACNHLLESIQAMALDIANDKQGDEILTDMEYKK